MLKIKPSDKMDNAYIISGMKGHFFLLNAKKIDNEDKVEVTYATHHHSHIWYEETMIFPYTTYQQMLSLI